MSQLNISLSSFGSSRSLVRRGYPLRETNLNLRVLARAVLSALNLKASDSTAEQAGQLVTDSQSDPSTPDTTQGCLDHVSDAEYQRLVEQGHWHHRRQRRRNRLR